ncbi:hypothetical protein [Actinomadura sp. 21ATH]|uniref:hypothetical protein n=1 Tax=Actinomadura sp. 21ATH TaxID=1735444 RepID=UPI0035C16BA8
MVRSVIWFFGACAFVLGGLGVYPLLLLITFSTGEPVSVSVERCVRSTATPREGATEVLDCTGSWRTPDGPARGHVSGVDRTHIGQRVAARSGPLGPYADPIWQYWQLYSPLPAFAWTAYLVARNQRRVRTV